jgi:hypothetical protein
MDPFNLLSSVIRSALLISRHPFDRPSFAFSVRYIPEVTSYIIEVTNAGWRAITITGAGITAFPWGYSNRDPGAIWLANEHFPRRLQDRDVTYLSVWWGSDVRGREKAS